ncbi:MAG TPA: polyhydroxyalkanoic acid system family protein, partial [Hyphomicrobiales bacterium]|nr:polyhydroxyalkanoic acid system family protein [Hyphomicrobiales bacterium]
MLITIPHRLGGEEALRRSRANLPKVKKRIASLLPDVEERWTGNRLRMNLKAAGFRIVGEMEVGETDIRIESRLPFLLRPAEHLIAATIRRRIPMLIGHDALVADGKGAAAEAAAGLPPLLQKQIEAIGARRKTRRPPRLDGDGESRLAEALSYVQPIADGATELVVGLRLRGAEVAEEATRVFLVLAAFDAAGEPQAVRAGAAQRGAFSTEGNAAYSEIEVWLEHGVEIRVALPAGAAELRCRIANATPSRPLLVRTRVGAPAHGPAEAGTSAQGPFQPLASLDGLPGDLAARVEKDLTAVRALNSFRAAAGYQAGGAQPPSMETTVELARTDLDAAITAVLNRAPRPNGQSHILEELAGLLSETDRVAAVRLFWLAYAVAPDAERARRLAVKVFRAGNITSAARLLALAGTDKLNATQGDIRLSHSLLTEGAKVPPVVRRQAHARCRVGYVAASVLPFITSGYTVRTHQLLRSARAAGIDITCYVRPGFPADRAQATALAAGQPELNLVEGVPYRLSANTGVAIDPEQYLERAATQLHGLMRRDGVTVVHAASNWRNALPAMIAARRLGVPFIYEVRGLWELSAATRFAGWEATERFALERRLELYVAREADRVLTITGGVAGELIDGGIAPETISLLPNAVDPGEFLPMPKDDELRRRYGIDAGTLAIVYCGSLTVYEGLDDLIAAVGLLRDRGLAVRFVVVGDGEVREALGRQAEALGLQDEVIFVGRVPPEEVRRYWSLADIVALPRKPMQVCEVVSPLKPFEAMAMGKPVVLSDLAALREIVRDGETGRLIRPADPDDLARVLQ